MTRDWSQPQAPEKSIKGGILGVGTSLPSIDVTEENARGWIAELTRKVIVDSFGPTKTQRLCGKDHRLVGFSSILY